MKKLTLSRETVRSLNESDLRGVAGGKPPTETNCSICRCIAPAPTLNYETCMFCDTRHQCE